MTIEEYLDGREKVVAQCPICQKNVTVKKGTRSVVISSEGIPQHRACLPRDSYLKDLKQAILQAYTFHSAKEEVFNRGLNWIGIMAQINQLLEEGFSTEEQLNCFNQCMKRDTVFWGYGRVKKFIDSDTLKYNQYKEFTAKQALKESSKEEQPIVFRQYRNGVVGGYGLIDGKFEEEEDEQY